MQTFAERGATVAHNPREVADASDVVITMLPSSPHVHIPHLLYRLADASIALSYQCPEV